MKNQWQRLCFGILIIFAIISFGSLAQDTNSIRVGIGEPINLDPATGSSDDEVILNRHIYGYLLEILPGGDLVPSLAESYAVSEDGLTYTFNLREGVTFHDGSAFTAEDVVFTFNRLVEVGSTAISLLGQEQVGEDDAGNPILEPTWTVEAPDDLTVVFTLDAPRADFLFGIASRFAPILPTGLDTPNNIAEGLDTFNGTGPFRLQEFNAGEEAVLVANEDYFDGAPALDQITFVFITDVNTRIDSLIGGDIDVLFRIPSDLLNRVENQDNLTVTTVATNTHPVIRLRSDEGHLGEDVRVRQAFKHATDRELLNIDFLNGLGTVGNNDPIGPVYGLLYNPQETLEYNPQLACDLLAEYAAENPDNPWVTVDGDAPSLEVDFYVVDALGYPVLGEFMQQQLQDGCINVNLIIRTENIYYGDNEWLTVDLGLTGWGTRPTPQEYLDVAYTTGAPFNEAHWSNEDLDALAAEAAKTADVEARAALYNQISQIFVEQGPIIVPFFIPVHGAYRSNISGLNMHPFPGRTDFHSVTVE